MKLRESLDGPWMVNNGYTLELATEAVASGRADLVAFGRAYVAHVRPNRSLQLRELRGASCLPIRATAEPMPHGMAYYA